MNEIILKIIHLASGLFSIAASLLLVIAIAGIGGSVLAVALSLIAVGMMIYGVSTYLQGMIVMLANQQWKTAIPRLGLTIIIAGLLILWIS